MPTAIVVASHNLMRGARLAALAAHHRALRARVGLDLLCVQEARCHADGRLHVHDLAAALGDWAAVIEGDPVHGMALVYDRTRLRPVRHSAFLLPKHDRMNLFERRILLDDRPLQIHALLAMFEPEGGRPFAVLDFHLDTVGGTRHRRAQVAAIAETLRAEGLGSRVVACGDTNAFALTRRGQQRTLSHVIEPLTSMGIRDAADGAPSSRRAPTHWFARQDEPGWLHGTVRTLARGGLDIPGRYDVICTDMPTAAEGHVCTPESDHDLIWATIEVAA